MSDRVALVTGAASGMGRECARRFAQEGWAVVGLDLDADGLDSVAVETNLDPVIADVRDFDALGEGLTPAVERLGPPSCCINAAGVYPPSTLETANESLYRVIFDTNVLGTVAVTRAVAPHMAAAGGGAVVNFASVDAFHVSPGQLLYCASKAAVVALTRSLALELAPSGIRVNAVAPGWVDTEGNRATGRMEGVEREIPLGRVASPEEIADLVWALSGEGRMDYVTGETIVASGGVVMR
jgi:NAD(P)-dependent dehydrogenase (short-subunit alcohol dehydrogenase family)